jgi:hypothetical protein
VEGRDNIGGIQILVKDIHAYMIYRSYTYLVSGHLVGVGEDGLGGLLLLVEHGGIRRAAHTIRQGAIVDHAS